MNVEMMPRIVGEYANVFRPAGASYRGPDGNELRQGQWYDTWVPNDHGFVRGHDGRWHLFGITHPLTSARNLHEGEVQLFHGEAPEDVFDAGIADAGFADGGDILPPSERPGEIKEIHSPFFVEKDGLHHMIYGPSPFRLATSADLRAWTLRGEIFRDAGGGRDPQVFLHEGKYHLYYCSGNEVRVATSSDLLSWADARTLLTMEAGVSPESPFMLEFEGIFYLFVCTWDDRWDRATVSQAYQHKTLVFTGSSPCDLTGGPPVTTIEAHAPEIFEHAGVHFISSAEWPVRGINVARLEFSPGPVEERP